MIVAGVFDEARAGVAAKLEPELPAGVPVTLDPAAVPPFVLVDLVRVLGAAGVGAWSTQVPVTIAVPPPGDFVAAQQLGELLEVVLRVLGPAVADPDLYTTAGGKDLPAYTLTYRIDVHNPDC